MRTFIVGIIVALFVFLIYTGSAGVVWGEEAQDTPDNYIAELISAIKTLQPHKSVVDDDRAEYLARIFAEAGEENEMDPKLLIAISFRESSFHPDFENRKRFGKSRGEIGLMQCHGACLKFRPEDCTKELEGARCQIRTGAKYLAFFRDGPCQGSQWRWVAAYGLGICPSEQAAGLNRGARNAFRFHSKIGGKGW